LLFEDLSGHFNFKAISRNNIPDCFQRSYAAKPCIMQKFKDLCTNCLCCTHDKFLAGKNIWGYYSHGPIVAMNPIKKNPVA